MMDREDRQVAGNILYRLLKQDQLGKVHRNENLSKISSLLVLMVAMVVIMLATVVMRRPRC